MALIQGLAFRSPFIGNSVKIFFSPTGGCRLVGVVRSWTQATEFSLVLKYLLDNSMV
jgi:hypothetical protein